jgi:hypothetical protein
MLDLHIHSNFSDGSETIESIIDNLERKEIKIFSITDHDTIKGNEYLLKNFKQKLQKNDLTFITGIEISTEFNNKPLHILAYNFELDNPTIQKLVKQGQKNRKIRTLKRIELLKSEFQIELPDYAKQQIIQMDNPGRMHIAKVLLEMKKGNEIGEILRKYLYHTVEIASMPAEYVVTELAKSGITSVIAHPLCSRTGGRSIILTPEELRKNVELLSSLGLNGLECFYSDYGSHEREIISSIAKDNGLLLSAGSDFHGKFKAVKLGELSKDNKKININEITILNNLITNKN